MKLKAIVLFILISVGMCAAQSRTWPVYRNGNILFYGPKELTPNSIELCRTLKSENIEITKSTCREEGRFQRNKTLNTYYQWLKKNLNPQAQLTDLSARSSEAKEWFKKHQYNHLILIFESEKEYHLAIFWGGQPYPHAIKTFKKNSSKVIELNIAQSFFNGETQRLMSKKERETQVQNADPYYSQKIIYDTYLTFSVENTYAISDHSDASVRNYRFNNSPDSSSQYDWTNEASTTFQFSAGKGYNGMFYGGLFGAYSEFEVKYDSTHLNITDWSYQRIDVGLEAYLGKTYALGESFDLYPYVYLRFMYTWMIESFEQSNSPADADLRVTLPTVKGGSAGIGTRLLFNGTHGIDFNMGISHRGQVAKEAFNPDPQETIGGTTNEVWLGMKYWLNFRYLE